MLLNIILSDFQQYRTLLAKVIQFFVSPEKCKNQRYKFLTPDRHYDFMFLQDDVLQDDHTHFQAKWENAAHCQCVNMEKL